MQVYIAAPWTWWPNARALSILLQQAGFSITRRWWERPEMPDPTLPEAREELARWAQEEIDGVREADALVLLNAREGEGTAVLQGAALALRKPIVAIGAPGRSIFHFMPGYRWVPTAVAAVEELKRLEHAQEERK